MIRKVSETDRSGTEAFSAQAEEMSCNCQVLYPVGEALEGSITHNCRAE